MHPQRHSSAASRSSDSREALERNRYVVFRPSLTDSELSRMYQYACYATLTGAMERGDGQVPDTPCSYGDRMMDGLLNSMLPEVQTISGLLVFPTYSYIRVYKKGDVLKRHVDRPACEISVSLCLGYDAAEPWPLWIEGPQGTRGVTLEKGEALLYRGMECPHWRDEFHGKRLAQVFLHYVDQHGPNAEWKFDKRTSLSSP
jgi:hypothetical protein